MKYKKNPKDCEHENVQKEYYLGTQTGDFICIDCGLTYAEKSSFKKRS